MNGQKTGLSENELELVTGGVTYPDTDENKRAWENLLMDIKAVLKRYLAGDADRVRIWQQKLGNAYTRMNECFYELHSNGDVRSAAMDLYHALMELRELPDIEQLRLRLLDMM